MPLGAFAGPPPLGLPVVEGEPPEPELDPFPALKPDLDTCPALEPDPSPPPEPELDPFPPPEPEVDLALNMISRITCALCCQQTLTDRYLIMKPRSTGTQIVKSPESVEEPFKEVFKEVAIDS